MTEALEVDFARIGAEQVAAGLRDDAVSAESLAQLRDVHLQRLAGGRRRLVPPQRVDQPLARDGAVRLEQEPREQRALLLPAQLERAPVVDHLERAEETEVHLTSVPHDRLDRTGRPI